MDSFFYLYPLTVATMPATVLIALTFLVIVTTIYATKTYTVAVVMFLTLITIVLAALCVFAALQTAMNRQNEQVRQQLNQMLRDLRNTERIDAERRLINEANERDLAAARARAREANRIRRPNVPLDHAVALLRQSAEEVAGIPWGDIAEMDDRNDNNHTG